jgi:signal transduction histidine kinase
MMTDSQRIGRALAIVPTIGGVIVLMGWQFRIPLMRGDSLGTFVAPNAALCFILCGAGILLSGSERRLFRNLSAVMGALVAAFSLATIAEYLLNINLGIDTLFFAHRMSDWSLRVPGRFAVNTAFSFTFAGMSLCAMRGRAGKLFPEICAVAVILIFYLSSLGYLFSASLLYGRVMALPTVVMVGVLGFALLFTASADLASGILMSPYAGGILSRRIITSIVILMPVIGLVWLKVQQFNYFALDFGFALFMLVTVTVFTVLTLRTATVLNHLDRKRRDTENALIRSEKLAAAGRMAATVAHEINNPLEAVGNLLYLLQSESLSDQLRRQYVQTAEQELNRVAAIARRTLGFYKDTAKPSTLDVCEVIQSTLGIYEGRIERKNITVRKSYPENCALFAPEGELRQVIANLISNAIDALPSQGGQLDIAVEGEDHFLNITIADNGHGISDLHINRIFEPFFSTKDEVGTGLGLWISRELVAKNGGIITLKSSQEAEGHGTSFTLKFPLGQAKRELPPVQSAGAATPSSLRQ